MIISKEEGLISWHKIEPPEIIIDDKDPHEQKIKILDEVD